MTDRYSSLLLLSGGIDSAAMAVWQRPDSTLFIDYGQRPARSEATAAAAVARELGLPHDQIAVDARAVGSGLLATDKPSAGREMPAPEWWPYRNQLLITAAAAWLISSRGLDAVAEARWRVELATVATDSVRHRDGTADFFKAMDGLLKLQEGGLGCAAPALALSSVELVERSRVTRAVLGWTHSCHVSCLPCGDCPGCHKRSDVLWSIGWQ